MRLDIFARRSARRGRRPGQATAAQPRQVASCSGASPWWSAVDSRSPRARTSASLCGRLWKLDYAHGTGAAANDKTECAAGATVFGRHADDLMISSTKSMHGHVIGGTGAVELLACIMALRDSVVAPTIGYEEADPECALDVVPNIAREASVSVALSNAFAFGGLNAVIALRKF